MADAQILKDIESKILAFQSGSLKQNTLNLFSTLGYYSPHQMNIFENTPEGFLEYLNDNSRTINKNQAYFSEWKNVDFCLQLTNEDVDLSKNQVNHFDSNINSYLLFCIELNKMHYPNRALADITRAMNRLFPKPVFVLFKHGSSLTLSIINRRKHKRDSTKEVLEKITLIKDIDVLKPHRAHIEILFDLSLFELKRNFTINNFDDLHSAWQSVLNISELNKKFYREIANWYFWAMDNVEFPKDAGDEKEVRNATSLIRLLTRLIFVWFLKEKHLVPDDLFDKKFLDTILEYKDKTGSTYYKAILQNLFFATLNTPMTKDNPKSRIFINDAKSKGFVNDGYLQSGYFRYKRFIKNPDLLLEKYSSIPFLNGGLFECLDEKTEGKEIRIDCFSDNPNNEAKLKVPDDLFFGTDRPVDLNKIYGTKNKEYKTRGLINILNSYKFTVAENTPVEEEVALDPELLGKVFENLLASYNPETGTTARKATGSFYTPREIVNYMVDESLIAYLHTKLIEKFPEDDFETKLRQLLRYTDEPHQFNKNEVELLLDAVENLKILDPACGSGAFPMGILHKLVYILYKLDPDNKIWIHKLIERTPFEIREETRQALKDKPMDYVRKLGLIESCIYGVDIQSIAIQISKLRFFISLIVEQKIDDTKENRDIKPLPNLETKFVAANILIALDKPKDSFAGEVLEIKEAEENLINIRKDIFYANSSSKKKQLALKEKQARQKLKTLLEEKGGFGHDVAEKITSWDPFDQNTHAEWFDPEWMFGVKVHEPSGFDVVIGNPPYISTKEIDDITKKIFQEQYGFADDTYNHFFFKGMDLLKNSGLLTYISSKTFWTIQTKRNLRNLLLDNTILILFDTANPFEAPMVDTCVAMIQKQKPLVNHIVNVLDGKKNLISPLNFSIEQKVYNNAPNKVLFIPNDYNKKIYERLGKKVNELLNQWWTRISTSKNIEKFKRDLEEYRNNLKPSDVTLLGLITEGGVGIQTANNGKFVGVLENTKWADNVLKQRPEKLLLADKFCNKEGIRTKQDAQDFLSKLDEKEIRDLFDNLKEKYGRDIFGQGWLFRIVSEDEIADVNLLTEDEKLNGIKGNKTFVPYDKGDKDGNRWYAPTPYYIDWSRENVKFFKENSGKKGEGMPVVRNQQFYFREGFCWTDVNSTYLKSRLKDNGVYDVLTMSLFTTSWIPDWYFVCLINSKFISEYVDDFINSTSHFQINDARQLPVIIPTLEQLNTFEQIFNNAYKTQKEKFENKISYVEAEAQLSEIQKELDALVEEMYMGIK